MRYHFSRPRRTAPGCTRPPAVVEPQGPLLTRQHAGKSKIPINNESPSFFTPSGNFLNDVDPLETLTYLEARVDTLTRVKHVEQKF